jgi:hypothetical protein
VDTRCAIACDVFVLLRSMSCPCQQCHHSHHVSRQNWQGNNLFRPRKKKKSTGEKGLLFSSLYYYFQKKRRESVHGNIGGTAPRSVILIGLGRYAHLRPYLFASGAAHQIVRCTVLPIGFTHTWHLGCVFDSALRNSGLSTLLPPPQTPWCIGIL